MPRNTITPAEPTTPVRFTADQLLSGDPITVPPGVYKRSQDNCRAIVFGTDYGARTAIFVPNNSLAIRLQSEDFAEWEFVARSFTLTVDNPA